MKKLFYELRRQLVWMLCPKTLFVFTSEKMGPGDGASVFDPEEMKPWASARFADVKYLGKYRASKNLDHPDTHK